MTDRNIIVEGRPHSTCKHCGLVIWQDDKPGVNSGSMLWLSTPMAGSVRCEARPKEYRQGLEILVSHHEPEGSTEQVNEQKGSNDG